jgi:flagellar export protein FliJ
MAFKYRLEKVLKLKRIDEQRAVEKLAVCRKEKDAGEQAVKALLSVYQSGCAELLTQGGSVSPTEYRIRATQLEILNERIQNLIEMQNKLDAKLDECRTETIEKSGKRKAHERLREKAESHWQRGQRREERKKMDSFGAKFETPNQGESV